MSQALEPAVLWDEMVDGSGRLRGRWQSVLAVLSGLGHETLAERTARLDRLCTEEGVAALLPGAKTASWRCDPLPLLLGAAEFAALESGLAQRARLLEAVLQDVYGPQSLLSSGALPPALVYANPAFLRPCRSGDATATGTGRRLFLYAAELMRGPDGAWQVLADRTADAAGLGYVLENRRVISRVMPELFGTEPPRRLQPFFDAWQNTLHALAPSGYASPFLALLTPGLSDKLWFEHVILARALSCTMVEGGDLTVRDGAVFLKTLRGLQRVDVLLRRLDGRTLDPLELEQGPTQGVLGLLDAARAGSVRIVNDPGTGFAEAPALAPFLARLAPIMLGEDLRLPSAPAFWLGDAAARDAVLAAPSRWCLRPALDGTARPVALWRMPAEVQTRLAARVAARGEDFIAFTPPPFSLAPCAIDARLVPQPVVLRMFLMFDGTAWRALPGGLARALDEPDALTGRLPLHTRAKDVWVAAEDAAEEEDALPATAHPRRPARPIRGTPGDMPSRAADNFFWLGRYLERLEGTARILRIAISRLTGPVSAPHEHAELLRIAACLADAGLLEAETAHGLDPGTVAGLLMHSARGDGPFRHLRSEASRLTEMLRDRLTEEVYTLVTRGLRNLGDGARSPPPAGAGSGARAADALDTLTTAHLTFCAAVAGLAAENMVRGGGRLFLDLGRRLERASGTAAMLARVLAPRAGPHPDPIEPGLHLALEVCDSVITYRSRYLTALQPAPVLDLVLADDRNPRGLASQFSMVRDLLAELSGDADSPLPAAASELVEEIRAIATRVADAEDQVAAAASVPAHLKTIAAGTAALSDRITNRYFSLLPAAYRLGAPGAARRLRGMA